MSLRLLILSCCTLATLHLHPLWAEEFDSDDALLAMDLDALMSLEVVSRHNRPEQLFTTPAAMHVISRWEIAESGAENILDLLNRVPGLYTLQLGRHRFGTAIRNEPQFFLATMLVLVDGRPIYFPVTGGVAWTTFNVPLADIERIEVIRGSGGSSWGANASTGVINILTQTAGEQLGTTLRVEAGSEQRWGVTAQHGVEKGPHALRLTAHWEQDQGFEDLPIEDDYRNRMASLRYDGLIADWDVRFNAGILRRHLQDQSAAGNFAKDSVGEDFYAQLWLGQTFVSGNRFTAQASFDNQDRPQRNVFIRKIQAKTSNVEIQYQQNWNEYNLTQFAANYRHYEIDTSFGFSPSDRAIDLYSLAWHHEIELSPRWTGEIGGRWEDYSALTQDWLFSPSLRLSFAPTDHLFLWAAATRSQQFPPYLQAAIDFPVGVDPETGLLVLFRGNPQLDAEQVTDFQLGMRWRPALQHLLELNFYYSKVDDLVSLNNFSRIIVSEGIVLAEFENAAKVITRGIEMSWRFETEQRWQTEFSVTYLENESQAIDLARTPGIQTGRKLVPSWKVGWTQRIELQHNTILSSTLTWLSRYEEENFEIRVIDAHFRLDLNLQHRINRQLQVSIGARNLFNRGVEQAFTLASFPQEVRPSYHLRATFQFD